MRKNTEIGTDLFNLKSKSLTFKMANSNQINIILDEKTNLVVNRYRDDTWIHIFQKKKDKNISFRKEELMMFFSIKNKILNAIQNIENDAEDDPNQCDIPMKRIDGKSKKKSYAGGERLYMNQKPDNSSNINKRIKSVVFHSERSSPNDYSVQNKKHAVNEEYPKYKKRDFGEGSQYNEYNYKRPRRIIEESEEGSEYGGDITE